MDVILRRNEAERNNALQYFFNAYSFGMHATKGRISLYQLLNLKPKSPSHPAFFHKKSPFFVFLHLFAYFFFSFRDQEYLLLPVWAKGKLLHFFLVCTCLKLPSPRHALRIVYGTHFWTGLARLFRTTEKKSYFFQVSTFFPVSFIFSKCRWFHLV